MNAIAIDGPGGAGKSTMARALAKQLGYVYVDTGALYRAIGLYMRRLGIPTTDFDAVAGNLTGVKVRLAFRNGEQRVFLGEEDVSDAIRTQDISIAASNVCLLYTSFPLEFARAWRALPAEHHKEGDLVFGYIRPQKFELRVREYEQYRACLLYTSRCV